MLFALVRVSHTDQNIDSQIKELLEYGVPQENIFVEKISGVVSNSERPVLQDLLSRLREGDTLVATRLDRLSRSMKSLLDLVETLQEKKVNFVSLKEDIRTDTPQGVLVFQIFCSLAEFQRSLIKQSQRAGIDACLEQGKPYGRPKVSEKTPEKLEHAIYLYTNSDKSTREIQRLTGVSRNTLYRELDSRSIPKRSEK